MAMNGNLMAAVSEPSATTDCTRSIMRAAGSTKLALGGGAAGGAFQRGAALEATLGNSGGGAFQSAGGEAFQSVL